MTVNQDIRDDIAAHDIDLRRVDGAIRRKVDQRFDKLGQDLKVLTVTIDPHGAVRIGARKRRLKKLQKEARALVSAAYSEINVMVAKDLKRLTRAESEAVNQSIEEALP